MTKNETRKQGFSPEQRRMTTVLTVEHTAPGGWLAAVILGRLAVVHRPDTDDGFAARLWAALCDDDGIQRVIDELARNGLTNAPGFVLAEWDGEPGAYRARFIVRGQAGVLVNAGETDEDITARGVATWVERPVEGVRGFRIECIPSEPAVGMPLPLSVGTGWVSALAFGSLASEFTAGPKRISASEWVPPVIGSAEAAPAGVPSAASATGAHRASETAQDAEASGTVEAQDSGAERTLGGEQTPGAEQTPGGEQIPGASGAASEDIDLDRTIADLEVTVAGEDASEHDRTPAAPEPGSASTTAPPVAEAPQETTGYDHLFGATLMRSVEDAAARPVADDADEQVVASHSAADSGPAAAPSPVAQPASGQPASAPAPSAFTPPAAPPAAPSAGSVPPLPSDEGKLGDHDGLTVMSGDIRALRESAGASAASAPLPQPSPPAPPVAEPGFVLQLPDGGTEPIDGMVVVGRAPSVSKMGGGRVPRLVTVDSIEHDISRNHVQLTLEGGTVVVTDLHSRNGTLIALPGKAPQKLRAGEPTSVIAGTVIDLGSGVNLGVVQA
jgi:hypothetical protein